MPLPPLPRSAPLRPAPLRAPRPQRVRRGSMAALAVSVLAVPAAAPALAAPPDDTSAALQRAVTLDGVLRHTRALQQIADVNGGSRVAGSPGYDASAGYVAGQLSAAGYDVRLQQFSFPFFAETAPTTLARIRPQAKAYTADEDFATMEYSGSGDVTARVVPVDVTLPPGEPGSSTSGCEPADFADFRAGSVALLQRGTCSFGVKAQNAAAAGAAAVLIFNEGQEGRTETLRGTLGGEVVKIPVVGTSSAVGQELAAGGTRVRVTTATRVETRNTYNVLAETRGGRSDNVVMLGAHLDSVEEGPGINDNGSGSAALLEVAVQSARTVEAPRNRLRFAWWSAEEFGLLGSEHYVEELSQAERGDLAAYLNFDMVASPNFARFVYDGDDSDREGAGPGPQGSAGIEDLFEEYFDARDLPTEGTDFSGRSDYGPFIAVGIPAGGLFTGAEGIKTEEQARRYGGRAGVAYDACYHQACDTSRNLSRRALDQNADAIAHAVATYASDTSSVNDRARLAAAAGARVAETREAREGRAYEKAPFGVSTR